MIRIYIVSIPVGGWRQKDNLETGETPEPVAIVTDGETRLLVIGLGPQNLACKTHSVTKGVTQ